MADEAGFLINDKHYPVPGLHTFTMDELEVMYGYCGLTLEDFATGDDETEEEAETRQAGLIRHPGFKRTLLHVAYQRGNPTVKRAVVEKLIGSVNFLEAAADVLEVQTEDPTVPSPGMPEESSSSETGSSSGNGGDGSEPSSTGQDTPPVITGTGGSDMSFLESHELTPAA